MRLFLSLIGMMIVSLVPGSRSIESFGTHRFAPLSDVPPLRPAIAVDTTYTTCGTATYYDLPGITANGETFNPKALTAAHPWIPFDLIVTITDRDTGRSIAVRINDRGPWVEEHMLDLTPTAMNAIAPKRTIDVRRVCLHW